MPTMSLPILGKLSGGALLDTVREGALPAAVGAGLGALSLWGLDKLDSKYPTWQLGSSTPKRIGVLFGVAVVASLAAEHFGYGDEVPAIFAGTLAVAGYEWMQTRQAQANAAGAPPANPTQHGLGGTRYRQLGATRARVSMPTHRLRAA